MRTDRCDSDFRSQTQIDEVKRYRKFDYLAPSVVGARAPASVHLTRYSSALEVLQATTERRGVIVLDPEPLRKHRLDLFERKLHDLTYDNVAVALLQIEPDGAIQNNSNVAVLGVTMSFRAHPLDAHLPSSPDAHLFPRPAATRTPKPNAVSENKSSKIGGPSSRLMREEIIKWLSDPRFTHALTLNLNRADCTLRTAKALFGIFCRDVDRMMLGKKRVERVHTCQRLEAIAFPEHLETNLHLHIMANFARRYWSGHSITEEQEAELARIWRRVTKGSGTSEIKLTRDAGWARYATKEMHHPDHDYIHSADFHSDRYVVYSLPALDDLAP